MLNKIAIWILRLRGLSKAQAEQHLTMYMIRKHLLAFGCDVSDRSDQEIEEALISTAKTFSRVGISMSEIESRMQ